MIFYGNNSYQENLKLCFDQTNPKSWDGSYYYDLITGLREDYIGDPAWLNNIGYFTISIVLQWYQVSTGYADHPIAKWNGTLQNASITLYNFGNYQGNGQDGAWGFIAGNGSWTSVGAGGQMTFNAKHHIVLQYNAVEGGQTWFNGSKNGGRVANGILGNSHTSTTSAFGIEGANPNGNGHSKIYHLSIWNAELSDNEITKHYRWLKSRYGVV